MPSAPAMLSKPDVESSDGRYLPGSISRSSRSRTTFAYSVRFRRCSPGGGVNGCRRAIELALERGDHRVEPVRVGPLDAERRHLAGAHLADDQLPLLAILVHVGRIERVHRQAPRRIEPGGLHLLAVAADAGPR